MHENGRVSELTCEIPNVILFVEHMHYEAKCFSHKCHNTVAPTCALMRDINMCIAVHFVAT